jgi:hypothetical protein
LRWELKDKKNEEKDETAKNKNRKQMEKSEKKETTDENIRNEESFFFSIQNPSLTQRRQ